MQAVLDFDTRLFRWINGHHCTAADWLLWVASQPWSWAIVLVAFFLLTTLRKEPRRWWLIMVGIALCFLLSDRLSVVCFKETFCRLRPCHVLDDVRMFRTSCGGLYGFVSSHAANVFALATLFALRYGQGQRGGWHVATAAYAWALLVGYSRPYLGKHYPGDVVCGALLGIVVGLAVYYVTSLAERKACLKRDKGKSERGDREEKRVEEKKKTKKNITS